MRTAIEALRDGAGGGMLIGDYVRCVGAQAPRRSSASKRLLE